MISPNKKPPEIQTKTLRLDDFSMGLNTTISGSLLNNNELQVAEDVSFEQKGTIMPRRGRRKRYEEEFSDSPCCGLGSYYKKDGTTKLLFAAGDKLYSDSPSISVKWDNQNDWEETNSKHANLDSSTTPGDIQIKEPTQIAPTFTRASVAYLEDGTQVPAGQPRFEQGKFGQAVLVEEGTTNIAHDLNTDIAWWNAASLPGYAPGPDITYDANEQALKVDAYSSDYNGHSCLLPIVRDTYYTITAKIKNTNLALYFLFHLTLFNSSNGVVVTNYVPEILVDENWAGHNSSNYTPARITFRIPSGVHPTATKFTMHWVGNGSTLAGIYIKDIQIEQKPYKTTWHPYNSTRSPETLTIPTAGVLNPTEGTISLWVKPPKMISSGGNCLWATSGTQRFDLWWSEHGRIGIVIGSIVIHSNRLISSLQDGNFHAITVTWGSFGNKLYIDGVLDTSSDVLVPSNLGSDFYVGSYWWAGYESNSIIDELRIDTIARTDEEIAEWYNANEPPTPDEYTTYLSHFDGSLSSEKLVPYAYWESAPKDVSQASNKASGKAVITQTLNNGQVELYSASAPTSNGTYSDWALALPDGTLQHPPDNFVKLKLKLTDTDPYTDQLNSRPVVHGLTVTFDGKPSATPILDDMSFGAEYMFTTLKDILVIANGQNAPYKWDGIGTPTLLGGSPPVLDFITTHNNRVWGVDAADKSRVRFSDILDPETWSVLNFIDFNPDDGDYITAMVRIGQDLVVSKQWSMALLTGNATTNYSVVWLDVEQGVTGKRALCNTNKYFTYVAQDGIRFTDFNTHAVASERLLPDWEKINKRRLNQAAMIYWRNYLLVSLPRDNSLYNNTVWAYDMLRNAWSIINGWNVSNWLIFKQYGEEVLLAADSTTGQIYEVMRYSRYDDTEPIAYSVRTKDFTFNAPERYKLFRNINLDLEATTVESPLTVDLIVDGEKVGEYSTIVPADDKAKVHRMILPPLYDAVIGRSLSLALRGRCGIQGIALTYSFGGIVPDEEV